MEKNFWLKESWIFPEETWVALSRERTKGNGEKRNKETYDNLTREDKIRVAQRVLNGEGVWEVRVKKIPASNIMVE